MKTRAFTLAELLAVIVILAALSAVLFPVFAASKESSRKTSCLSNLRQIYVQTAIYRSDCGGEGNYGTVYEMGLPPQPIMNALPLYDRLRCPDAPHPIDKTLGSAYYVFYTEPSFDGTEPTWADYSSKFRDAAVIYADPFHNPANLSLLWGAHLTRFMQGVNLGGSLVRKSAKGDWQTRSWWNQ